MVYFYIIVTLLLLTLYVSLLVFILYKWQQSEPTQKSIQKPTSKSNSQVTYSILIPVRNEEENIKQCLSSILANKNFDFSKVEILVIDDYSEDQTAQIVHDFKDPIIKLLSLNDYYKSISKTPKINAYKKAALNLGLQNATGEYIIQLDGDVLMPGRYLESIDNFITEKKPDFVAAPVVFTSDNSIFQNFQVLDFLGMMLVTQAGIKSKKWYMANGANMIYKRDKLNFNVRGQASGDDVFGIQSISKSNNANVCFFKSHEATVATQPQNSLNAFISQRLRWSTKNKQMDFKMITMMSIPFLNALMIPIHFLAIYYFGITAILICISHLMIKMMIDYIYLNEAAQYFKKTKSMKSFVISFFMHFLYLGGIGLLSLFVKKYSWKGRKVF